MDDDAPNGTWDGGDDCDEDDPKCPDCGCDLYTECHDWDCWYVGSEDDVFEEEG